MFEFHAVRSGCRREEEGEAIVVHLREEQGAVVLCCIVLEHQKRGAAQIVTRSLFSVLRLSVCPSVDYCVIQIWEPRGVGELVNWCIEGEGHGILGY